MRGVVQNAVGWEGWGVVVVISHPCSQGPRPSGLSPPCKSLNSLIALWNMILRTSGGDAYPQLFCGGKGRQLHGLGIASFLPTSQSLRALGYWSWQDICSLTLSQLMWLWIQILPSLNSFCLKITEVWSGRNLWQNLPEKPERVFLLTLVLGRGSFSWEGDITGRWKWATGLTGAGGLRGNVDRAWGIAESPQEWILGYGTLR